MDMSPAWLSEIVSNCCSKTEIEMGFTDQICNLDTIDNIIIDSFSSEPYTENLTFIDQSSQSQHFQIKLPNVQEMCSNIISDIRSPTLFATSLPSSKTFSISFGDLNPKEETLELHDLLGYEAADATKVPTISRNPIQAQDHVLAERKRREKLNQHFISLSSLLPKLNKMDKATVMEDAISYIKELQGRVKELEALSGSKRNNTQESVISIKRSRLSSSDDYTTSDESNSDESTDPWKSSPEIEVRMSGSSVLVRIECQKKSYSLVKALMQIRKLGLSIISSSAMLFANTAHIINIVAQIEDECCVTATDLVKSLQLAI